MFQFFSRYADAIIHDCNTVPFPIRLHGNINSSACNIIFHSIFNQIGKCAGQHHTVGDSSKAAGMKRYCQIRFWKENSVRARKPFCPVQTVCFSVSRRKQPKQSMVLFCVNSRRSRERIRASSSPKSKGFTR